MFLTKKRKALLFLGLVILLMVFPAMLVNHRMEETDYCVEKDCPDLMSPSKVSGTIMINGNLGWIDFRNAGNCTGSGTDIDPYVIEDLIIDGQGSEPCILIGNSDVYFRIENCSLFNALNISEYSGSG